MKKILLGTVAVLFLSAPAVAADMPVKAPVKMIAAPYNWSGLYLGAHCGAAWARTRHTGDDAAYQEAGNELYQLDPTGIMCGGQVGYNFQQGTWLWGVEGDFGYISAKKTIEEIPSPDNLNEVKYGAYGTATLRLGLVQDRILFYAKGGAAFAQIRNIAADLDGGVIDPTSDINVSKTRIGWAAGGGIEYGLTPAWSLKAEYLYMGFGTQSYADLQGGTYTFRNQVHTAKVGINYHFGH